MNAKMVEEIANAVLYEGYMLYPYRASSVKNKQRWNFGVLYPKNYSELQNGTDPCRSQTECLVSGTGETKISVKVRFLQAISRVLGDFDRAGNEAGGKCRAEIPHDARCENRRAAAAGVAGSQRTRCEVGFAHVGGTGS